jgi:uncharacterized membrane protein HdeD (DUF308 family)
MKSKWWLVGAIFQILVGLTAIFFYVYLGLNGENMVRWTITLLLAMWFVFKGVYDILLYKKQ